MLDVKEIDSEIARLEYVESSYSNYAKLADLYTIRNQMKASETQSESVEAFPVATPVARVYGDSIFLQKVAEKDPQEVWSIIDELMDTLRVVNPKVYQNIMRRIEDL